MDILISESQYRSRVWLKSLEEISSNTCLISILNSERVFYKKNNINLKKIIFLDQLTSEKKLISLDNAKKINEEFERNSNLLIFELVKSDRRLRRFSNKVIIRYTATLIRIFEELIKNNNFKFCFLELTWHHEIILTEICNIYNIKVLKPVRCKIAPSFFYLFMGSKNIDFLINKKNNFKKIFNTNQYLDINYLEEKLLTTNKIKEANVLKKRNNINIRKFIVFIDLVFRKFNGGFYYYIHQPFFWYIKYKIKCILRKMYLNFFYDFNKLSNFDKELKYIFVPLHVQPEAGIDIIGRNFSDQINFVRNCSKSLPTHYKLIIKDHPADFGRKKKIFYDEIKKIPNCIIVHPKENNRNLIKNASLVISAAGTSSLEASLMGVPSVTATKLYFHSIMLKDEFNPYFEKISDLIDFASKNWIKFRYSNKYKDSLSFILSNRFAGNVGAADLDKDVLSINNLKQLKEIFNYLLEEFK